jgi:hypothetical protein
MLRMRRWTRSMALAGPAVLGSLLGSPAATAILTPVPLVAVEGSLREFPLAPDPPLDASLALFVLPGGDVVDSLFHHEGLPLGVVGRGPVTAALLEELRGILAIARPGIQGDCGVDSSDLSTSFTTTIVVLDWRITWFGRHGRRNAFRVATDQGLPRCPGEVVNLIREIFRFRSQFYDLPTTQMLDSLPH